VGAAWPFTRLLFFLLEDLDVPVFADFAAEALLAVCEDEVCEPGALELFWPPFAVLWGVVALF
jgi:hypothetical protein